MNTKSSVKRWNQNEYSFIKLDIMKKFYFKNKFLDHVEQHKQDKNMVFLYQTKFLKIKPTFLENFENINESSYQNKI